MCDNIHTVYDKFSSIILPFFDSTPKNSLYFLFLY